MTFCRIVAQPPGSFRRAFCCLTKVLRTILAAAVTGAPLKSCCAVARISYQLRDTAGMDYRQARDWRLTGTGPSKLAEMLRRGKLPPCSRKTFLASLPCQSIKSLWSPTLVQSDVAKPSLGSPSGLDVVEQPLAPTRHRFRASEQAESACSDNSKAVRL